MPLQSGRELESEGPGTMRFVRPHWRRGYKRRPKGSAPTAEKTVKVPPVLVREDLVPIYGLVGGTTSIVVP